MPCVGTLQSSVFGKHRKWILFFFYCLKIALKNIPVMFTFDISVKHCQRSPVKREADTDGCKQLQVFGSQLLTSDEG